MALVCCKAIGKGCTACCDAIGDCCKSCCDACSDCCDRIADCCNWCSEACKPCKDAICPDDAPAPIYVIFSCLINLATVIVAAVYIGLDAGVSCSSSTTVVWYALIIVVSVINVIFAFYLHYRFKQHLFEMNESACTGAMQLCLWDCGVFLYGFVGIFLIVWLAIYKQLVDNETACKNMAGGTTGVIVCVAIYLAMGLLMILLSVCTTCCNEGYMREMKRRKDLEQTGGGGGGAAPAAVRPPAQQQPVPGAVYQGRVHPAAQPAPAAVYPQPRQQYGGTPAVVDMSAYATNNNTNNNRANTNANNNDDGITATMAALGAATLGFMRQALSSDDNKNRPAAAAAAQPQPQPQNNYGVPQSMIEEDRRAREQLRMQQQQQQQQNNQGGQNMYNTSPAGSNAAGHQPQWGV